MITNELIREHLTLPKTSPIGCFRMKLEEGPASWRVEALILIAHLQIMTAKLLPPFLKCFNDNFVAVRKQACLTAAALIMKYSMVRKD